MIRIKFYGHSAFTIMDNKGTCIWIDPWLDNPLAPKEFDKSAQRNYILVTHAHGDHLGNTEKLAKELDATVIAIHEITVYLQSVGVKKVVGMNIGGACNIDDIKFIMVPAMHSSSIQDGNKIFYAGEPCGFVVKFSDGKSVYHAGDTGLFGDMSLIAELYKPDVAIIPIGGHYVMGPQEAAYATKLLKPKVVIPMHYETFPVLYGKCSDFETELEKLGLMNDVKLVELKPGEIFEF